MVGAQPPFLYDKPSSYTFAGPLQRGFDPKAATRASWTPPVSRPKQEGPLIDFNKHPDSYLIVPYGNLNVQPMNPKTKTHVKRARKVQLLLRSLGLLGAICLLFCAIAIRNTSSSISWIIRLGPAAALCHCVYGIYHLARDAVSRSPASTSSYMVFAGMIDTGLVPFFAFSAIMANTDYTTNLYGWTSVFDDNDLTNKIIFAFFISSAAEGGLLFVSLVLDIYLAIVFRKIAKMPPDMNPLEDNLTARPNGKHKRNKSEMVFEKHLSSSTLASQRMPCKKGSPESNFKRIPFKHTRTDSADSITLYGDDRALNSRVSLRNEIEEAYDYRDSMASSRGSSSPTRPRSAVTPAANARAPGAGLDHKPIRSSVLAQHNSKQTSSWLSYSNNEGVPTQLSDEATNQLNDEVRPLSPVSMMSDHDISPDRTQLERQNWYQGSPRNNAQSKGLYEQANISDVSFEQEQTECLEVVSPHKLNKRSRDPLGMNPPTPNMNRFRDENIGQSPAQPFFTPSRQVLANVQVNSSSRPGMGSRPSSFVGSGGKSRYYGNLRNSLGGSPTRESFESPYRQTYHEGPDDYSRTRTMESEDSGNFKVYDSDDNDDEIEDHQRQLHQTERMYQDDSQHAHPVMLGVSHDHDQWNGVRKTSNSTGYDLKSGYAGLGSEFGIGLARRREVSGKVAEEGRGGAGHGNIGFSETRDGAVVTGQGERGGAAGWARFHGR